MSATSLVVLVLAVLPSFSIPGNPDDKLLHVVAFAVLALLAAGTFPRLHLRQLWMWLVGFAAAIELIQMIMQQGREADWNDFMFGMGGAAAALLCVFLGRRIVALLSLRHESSESD
ncbi:hypothetical protein GRI69_04330 [Erythrobacter vulgaris]|uniref:VanZ-like domain-containing protein n=1 Tax=Qipengyuania vulgaris TaxID=291985 RepID=A0A844XR30_9SPHN|nr:VanZ family protein [Qipengyuania vulgaris]MXO47482.1 hypothetical protein [Qipengyuania vulgaris]